MVHRVPRSFLSPLFSRNRELCFARVLQAAGMWDEAAKAAGQGLRGDLVAGHAAHARHAEVGGDLQGAMQWYTAAQAHR